MPLYIRDDTVAALARDVQRAAGVRTVTDAVRQALEHERDRLRDRLPAHLRLEVALALADAIGGPSSDDADR